ncbi:MAG: phosphoribosylglycinamide formyltransferase [Planctomycetota bacterium]
MPQAEPPNPTASDPWRSPKLDRPVKLAVLVSGGGTTLANLAKRIEDGVLFASVETVVVSREGVGGLGVCERHGLPATVIPRKPYGDDVERFSCDVFGVIRRSGADLVCLAGFLSLLRIPDDFRHRVLNIHPSLLPGFGGPGMYGTRVHEAVIRHGAKLSGCTVHFADNTYDTGPIVAQRACPVEPDDTPATLAARVFEQECEAFPEAIADWAEGRVCVRDGVARITPQQ